MKGKWHRLADYEVNGQTGYFVGTVERGRLWYGFDHTYDNWRWFGAVGIKMMPFDLRIEARRWVIEQADAAQGPAPAGDSKQA